VLRSKSQHTDDALPAAGSSKGNQASAAASGKASAQGQTKQDTHPAEAAGDTSEVLQGDQHPTSHGNTSIDADQMTGRLSVLSVDDGRRGAAAAAEKRKRILNGSVIGKNMTAGKPEDQRAIVISLECLAMQKGQQADTAWLIPSLRKSVHNVAACTAGQLEPYGVASAGQWTTTHEC